MWSLHPFVSGDWIIPNLTCALFFNMIWILEDKTDRRKLSNIFTLWGSSLITITSGLYIITQRPEMAILCHSIFYNHMLFELVYGYLYFPQYMYGLTTYLHHMVYLFFEYFLICETAHFQKFVYYFPQEFPTFLLALKRYFEIDNDVYNFISLCSFLFFRFFYFLVISHHYRFIILENNFYVLMFVMIGILQTKWCVELLQKTIAKLPFGIGGGGVVNNKDMKPVHHAISSSLPKQLFPYKEMSFASSGWMQIFQCGVGKYIQENFQYEECEIVGTSGGALIGCSLCCGISMDTIFDEMIITRKFYNNNIFMMCNYTKVNIQKMLPDNCIALIKNRLTIVCSKIHDFAMIPLYTNSFQTRDDLLKYLYATIHIPLMDGCLPHEIDNQLLYDGLLTDSYPQVLHDCLHVNWDRTYRSEKLINPEIKIPLYWCIFPPSERVLLLLYRHGYYQAQKHFLRKEENPMEAEAILAELIEEMKNVEKTDKVISNVMYILKGGLLFCGCLGFSHYVL